MTDKEVLQKAIEIAIENGYKYHNPIGLGIDERQFQFRFNRSYFSHDFAKAFWGDKTYRGFFKLYEKGYSTCMVKSLPEFYDNPLMEWQYHLQQMVLCSNPIDYLRQFLSNTEPTKSNRL
jgi:hypothetical protein